MTIIYTLSIIVITLILNASVTASMPYIKTKWKAFITRKKPKKHIPIALPKQLEELVVNIMKDKINNGLLTYHKKKMIREFVREEVVAYLNELKTK